MAYSYLADSVDSSQTWADIVGRDVQWETYSTARLITDKDLQLIRRYDKRSPELKSSMLDESGPAYVEAFMTVLKNVTKPETVQYVLALLIQMLQENPSRARLFHQQSDQHLASQPDPYTVLERLLQRQDDWWSQDKACKLLTIVIESRPRKSAGASTSDGSYAAVDTAETHISLFLDWLVSQLNNRANLAKNPPTVINTAISCLAALLKERGTRQLFLRAGGLQVLPGVLQRAKDSPTSSQLLYETCLCVWQMTYLRGAADVMGPIGLVKLLVEVCRVAQKEKVFRMALASLRNLLGYQDLGLASDMVEAGLNKVVITRQMQSWGDEDVVEMLGFVDEKLKEGIIFLSNFEKYKKEIMGGQLDWSPMHTSDLFWRENVDKFEERDFQVLRVLLKIIETNRDVKTLAVGCHDLGQFIVNHAQGRYIVNDLRGKELVMRLLSHSDVEVQKQALLCVQKLMLSKDKLDFLKS
ncbi:V-type proton ATPase subunit H [Tetrabaena socialis]|uniref:V-type proton ATPase subunit H n=1 Tax=Tetrabaena socialis TaxID=47790 RepID=A0A2J8A3Y6_9CHLO|nr:V-type proton ATPase subunit H [Tetrabaena socialis]|eukprot:PNH07217.1 V-type proton ATPase subunit H [Tetrabaena socialis]